MVLRHSVLAWMRCVLGMCHGGRGGRVELWFLGGGILKTLLVGML